MRNGVAVTRTHSSSAGQGTAHIFNRGKNERWEELAMPTYAYRCTKCGETFERIETISEHGKSKVKCPKCDSEKVVSVPTVFVAMTAKKS
jgi:putative FmdB family regulatory protein